MEPAAVWMPGDLQLQNWTSEPAVYAPGTPAMGYASTHQLYDSCHHQVSIPFSEVGQQCDQYEVVATQYDQMETTKAEFVVDFHSMEMVVHGNNTIQVFKDVAEQCNGDANITKRKMHRYPASIRALSLEERHTAPLVVAIGPYHHGGEDLEPAEQIKHVAAYQCIKDSGQSPEKIYGAVVQAAHRVRRLYHREAMAKVGCEDFLHMMFFDACFLVQYMVLMSDYSDFVMAEESLLSFFDTNDNEIFHDIMLLENQIPWPVVEAVMEFRPVKLEIFVNSLKGCLQDHKSADEKPVRLDHGYKPLHLLGLLRHHIVDRHEQSKTEEPPKTTEISLSVSANELAEMGIKLKPNKTIQLVHMGVKKRCAFGDLFLAPLSLDDTRVSCLISMAALELCTTSNFQDKGVKDEASAVCSYLLLLAMLVATEEDVQKLRTKHVLQGAGLANKEALDFFKKLHGLRLGSCYVRTMIHIQQYKDDRWMWIKVYAFWYRYKKIVATVVPICLSVIGILVSLNKSREGS